MKLPQNIIAQNKFDDLLENIALIMVEAQDKRAEDLNPVGLDSLTGFFINLQMVELPSILLNRGEIFGDETLETDENSDTAASPH